MYPDSQFNWLGFEGRIWGLMLFGSPVSVPGEGNGYPLQYSCLENSMNREFCDGPQSMESQRVGHNLATEQQSVPDFY